MKSIFLFFNVLIFQSINNYIFPHSLDIQPSKKRIATHHVYGAVSNQKYVIGWLPGVFGNVENKTSNVTPAFSQNYEYQRIIYKNFGLSCGVSATFAQFRINNTNFVSPSILNGYINRKVNHNYISIPISAFWKIPISEKSTMYIYGGLESFKTIKFEQRGDAFGSIYRNDGSSINSYTVTSIYRFEKFSPFRIFNFGLKLRLNENTANRIMLGINYNLMRSYWPLEVRTNFNISNINFYTENHIYFSGMRFSIGYFW